MKHRPVFVSLLAGIVFAVGLGVSGMTDANKVIAFLNVVGDWDYALALVMGGALAVYSLAYQIHKRRQRPVFAAVDHLPTSHTVDARLLAGSTIFGIGWGLGGFCPGPGFVSLVSGSAAALTFSASTVVGMVSHRMWSIWREQRPAIDTGEVPRTQADG